MILLAATLTLRPRMKKTTVAIAVLAVSTVALTTVSVMQFSRANVAEQKATALQGRIDRGNAFVAAQAKALYGQCDKLPEHSKDDSASIACLAVTVAQHRDKGDSESQAYEFVLSIIPPDNDDAARAYFKSIVHNVYSEWSQLAPAHVYGAVYEMNEIRNKLQGN